MEIVSVVACEAGSIQSAHRLYQSIKSCLSDFDVHFELLVYNTGAYSAAVIERLNSEEPGIQVFETVAEILPIVDSRNKCQQRLLQCLNESGGVGMVLDDDLLWQASNVQFSALLKSLRESSSDMAFLGMNGDAPVPREYVRAEPLLDMLLAIRDAGFLVSDIEQVLSRLELDQLQSRPIVYEEAYYSRVLTLPENSNNKIELNNFEFLDFLRHIYIGKATTRPAFVVDDITSANGLERGGATLFLNKDVLSIKNFAFSGAGLISRKSDVLMATEAYKKGFCLHLTPPVLLHCRGEAFDFNGSAKLVSDVFAYALVIASHHSFSAQVFKKALVSHIELTCMLIESTNLMLHVLKKYFDLRVGSRKLDAFRKENEIIKKIFDENEVALRCLKEFPERIEADSEFWRSLNLVAAG